MSGVHCVGGTWVSGLILVGLLAQSSSEANACQGRGGGSSTGSTGQVAGMGGANAAAVMMQAQALQQRVMQQQMMQMARQQQAYAQAEKAQAERLKAKRAATLARKAAEREARIAKRQRANASATLAKN